MKTIAVFCGSSPGIDDIFETAAFVLGKTLAEKKIELIYGGAKVGLMGAVARGALEHGGIVTGVLPRALRDKELAQDGLSKLIWTDSMHERKAVMHNAAEGIIALPGGYGTLDELFESLTWAQLRIHRKPTGILNIAGFYNPLLSMLDVMVKMHFLNKPNRDMLIVEDSIPMMLLAMANYIAPSQEKWLSRPDNFGSA